MPSEHIRLRRELKEKEKSDFLNLLGRAMLSETERKMMTMYYCECKPLCFIADTLGYSEVGMTKLHNRVLRKLGRMLANKDNREV